MLFMLVTFSTGFGKTTADLTKNSKTELVQSDSFTVVAIDFVNVVPYDFVANDSLNFSDTSITTIVKNKTNYVPLIVIVTDVGWRNSRINYKQLAYKEKLLDSSKNHSKNKLVKLEHRIRDNPFSTTISIPIYNYRC